MTDRPRRDVAFDARAVASLLAPRVDSEIASCSITVLKDRPRRVVARYTLRSRAGDVLRVAAKWYSTDRGELVANELSELRAAGLSVPKLVGYWPEHRVLVTEWVSGRSLTSLLEQDAPEMVAAARATGEWAARLHGSAVAMPRSCGPPKQQRALERWSAQTPELGPIAERVSRALLSARDPEMPVHYDHYHQQVLVGAEDVTVVDLDEAGRGDPAFDVAHFRAHLELLAFQHRGDGAAYDAARDLYRAGYESVGPWPADDPLLSAFAWCKLANQLLARNAPVAERRYAISALEALAGML